MGFVIFRHGLLIVIAIVFLCGGVFGFAMRKKENCQPSGLMWYQIPPYWQSPATRQQPAHPPLSPPLRQSLPPLPR
jgi:hypothetical protein